MAGSRGDAGNLKPAVTVRITWGIDFIGWGNLVLSSRYGFARGSR